MLRDRAEDTPFELSLLVINYRRRFREEWAEARALRAGKGRVALGQGLQ